MDEDHLWNLARGAMEAIFPHYQPVFERFSAKSGLDLRNINQLIIAYAVDPQTITADRLTQRNPYNSLTVYRTRLMETSDKGFLAEVAPGEYRLTNSGRDETERLILESRALMSEADPLTPWDSKALAGLLDRMVRACHKAQTPPRKLSFQLSYALMPAQTPPLPFIEQALTCLEAYHDDAHVAAWQEAGLNPAEVEVLTYLWRGVAGTLDSLVQRIGARGHSPQELSQTLGDLHNRGLVDTVGEISYVTAAGKALRDQVEQATRRYANIPWACLDENDRQKTGHLLSSLTEGLKAAVA